MGGTSSLSSDFPLFLIIGHDVRHFEECLVISIGIQWEWWMVNVILGK